jgi:predicted transposase/invertase (TIGR01784 family)
MLVNGCAALLSPTGQRPVAAVRQEIAAAITFRATRACSGRTPCIQPAEGIRHVSVKLLDPTNDLVFKMLLLRKQDLLRDMIEAVLDLKQPIRDLEVQNPEIPRDFPGDKGVVLDIRVRLHDGRQLDLEMQSTVAPGTCARFLFYWAKMFTDSLGMGQDYTLLRPCISILWFKEPLPKGSRFHSIFHLSEDQTRETFTNEIEFHVLELPKLHLATADRQAKLDRWARFLRAQTAEELAELAHEDPIMTTAKDMLEDLSSDPAAQRLARERETAVLMHRHLMNSSLEHGLKLGEARGEARGEAKAVLAVLEARGLAVTDQQRQQILECADIEHLDRWIRKAVTLAQVSELFEE